MPRLQIPRTHNTPELLFDPEQGVLRLEGCSIHENAERFFRPLLEEVERYIRKPAPHTAITVALDYFNSSSSKYMLDLFRLFDEILLAGNGSVLLTWHFAEDDLDMEEAGHDYGSLLEMPVVLVRDPAQ